MIDVDGVTRRVRGKWGAYVATKILPSAGKGYFIGSSRKQRSVHDVERLEFIWDTDGLVEVQAAARCRAAHLLAPVRLLDRPVDGVYLSDCRECAELAMPLRPMVYLARVGTELKIGRSASLDRRIAGLRGTLIKAVPGGTAEEHALIQAMTDVCVRGREWLLDTPQVQERVLAFMRAVELDNDPTSKEQQ